PAEHGRFVMYRRAARASVFRGFGALSLLPHRVRHSGRMSRLLTRIVRARGVSGYFQLYEVPRALLPEFDLAERGDPFAPGGLPRAADGRGEPLGIYLLSDHGMVDVNGTVDVMGTLARLPVAWPRDYLAFFDATMARFWWRGARARELVHGALGAAERGRWLTAAERAAAGITPAWGEDVFLLEPGALLVPSF